MGNTTTTDPRSRRNRVGRRGGQLLTRALGSSYTSACPLSVLPVPLVPDGRTIRRDQQIPAERAGTAIFIPVTNAIESVNARLRKIIKTRGHFPTDDAANKLIWLALRNITADWGKAAHHWKEAMNQFAILYDDRFNAAG